ncbi:type II toxin-antitoxin system VapC family toxin [Spirosoma rhododendri]|uniref:Type II toxin-antitoxin system VapC family toxin n=1 Tax=Spirosoma rhododendri TaxID=2728024 RepID=A0A7L5DI04_9BACT|nr:type II toxin-antitoxin system VapC family toxin [Spirosoma rhododendri]QJD77976.1 type II toxin-antitoxin system VapC family toxin [Spirosoma rhododendri]
MIYDTNLIINHIRQRTLPPAQTVLSIVTIGEIEAFALKSDWGLQRWEFVQNLFSRYPSVDITQGLIGYYAQIDAFSQNKLRSYPLGTSARNMGKNDLWIAATALYLDMELHTTDNDFDHLPALGLRLIKH